MKTLMTLVLVLGACESSNFSGTAPRKAGVDTPQPAQEKPKDPPTADATPVPTTTTPDLPAEPADSDVPVDETGDEANPDLGTDENNAKPSLFDIIGNLIKTLKDPGITTPNDNEIEFGGAKVFHIGDGDFSADSECASRIRAHDLKGTKFFFEFEVMQDNTTVSADVLEICGLDYNESNSLYLKGPAGDLEKKALPIGTTSSSFTGKVLAKGKYTILAESRAAGAENPQNGDDHDDYIVGKVKIKADKPIKPGKVGASP